MDDRNVRLTRRKALQAATGAAVTSVTASLGFRNAAAQDATPASITIPESQVDLPTGDVTFQWVDSGDSKANFFQAFFPAYEAAHPNISMNYQPLPGSEIRQLVPLGVQSGNAPDVFQTPPGTTPYQMVREGWIQPIDDYIPDFEAWKNRFPPGVLVEGITMFDGKVYACPYLSNRQYSTLLLYNVDYLQQADVDPSAEPLTWSSFRDVAKKVTEQGNGQYYGLVIAGQQTPRWAQIVSQVAAMAGAAGGEIDWRTGEYNYTSDAFLGVIDLLLAIQDDGSIFPGSMSLNAPQARAQMPQGIAGMILQGPWNIPTWMRDNPEFNFGVSSQPLPDTGNPLPLGVEPGAFIPPWLYAESKNPVIAGDIFNYLTSVEGQTTFAQLAEGFPPPILPDVRAAGREAGLDQKVTQAYDLFDTQMRVSPDPRVRNPDAAQVFLEMQSITPDLGETVQGIMSGQLGDAPAAMQDLQDRASAELDRAIKAAQDNGAEVSRDDWVFPNWDPTQDYTDELYQELD